MTLKERMVVDPEFAERRRVRSRLWNANHAQYVIEYKRAWAKKNRVRLNEYQKKRFATNVNAKLAHHLRARLARALRIGSHLTYLGCTIEELKKHLEVQFMLGMNWENWSPDGWHIDHIKPLSSFDLTDPEQFKIAVHYTNLQPLWSEANRKKYNR